MRICLIFAVLGSLSSVLLASGDSSLAAPAVVLEGEELQAGMFTQSVLDVKKPIAERQGELDQLFQDSNLSR